MRAGGGHLTLFVGSPGAGKSTLVEHLTRGLDSAEMHYRGTALRVLWYEPGRVLEFGRHAEPEKPRRGSDRLDMAAARYMAACLRDYQPRLALGEGQRVMSRRFMDMAVAQGYTVQVWWLDCSEELAQARLSSREKPPTLTWLRGQRTRVERFAKEVGAARVCVGDASLAELEERLFGQGDLVVAALAEARGRLFGTLPHW